MLSQIDTRTLGNGLRLICAPYINDTISKFAVLQVFVKSGPRFENSKFSGIGHFVEHLLFRGCAEYPSSTELNAHFETLGDGLQGATTREYSNYSIEVPRENLEAAIRALGLLFSGPLLKEIETEKGIVFEEIQEELDEQGSENLLENVSRSMIYGSEPVAKPILGRKPSVGALTSEDVRHFFNHFYAPSQMIVVCAGAVNESDFFYWGEKYLSFASKFPTGDFSGLEGSYPVHGTFVGPRLYYLEESSSQIETLISFRGFSESEPEFFSQLFLERLLDDGLSSRLQRSLCENRGLLYDINASTDTLSICGLFEVSFRVSDRNLSEVIDLILEEFEKLQSELIPEAEFEKVQARLSREADQLFERAGIWGIRLGEIELFDLPLPKNLADWKARFRAVSREDIQDLARRLFNPANRVIGLQGKLRKGRFLKLEKQLT